MGVWKTLGEPTWRGPHDIPTFLELYVLSDKLCIEGLRNEISDVAQEYIRASKPPLGPALNYIYGHTLKGSRMRDLLVHQLVHDIVKRGIAYEGARETWEDALGSSKELAFDAFHHLHIKHLRTPECT